MKTVGIITFHRSLNCGSALLAYSLASFLNQAGFHAEVIDFIPHGYQKLYGLFHLPLSLSALKRDLLLLIPSIFNYQLKRKKNYNDFITKIVPLSKERKITAVFLPGICEKYDAVICGSDQIWNPRCTDFDEGFFLPYGKNFRRIAYAVSLGRNSLLSDHPNQELIRKSIAQFDHISVREQASIKKLESFFPEKVDTTIDPTMLVNKEAFYIIAAPGQTKRQFIFLYSVKMSKKTIQAARDLSNRTGLPVLSLFSGRASLSWLRNKDMIPAGKVGPQEFLAYIRDAEYVVTDSFHGSVFSLIFQKNFFIIEKEDSLGNPVHDERINTLCDIFNIKNRFIKANDIKYISLDCNIDWNEIESLRQKYAEDSKKFLLNALSDIQ